MKKRSIIALLLSLFMLCGCSQSSKYSITDEDFDAIKGEYYISDKDGEKYGDYWALDLTGNEEEQPYLSFYDTVGNPGAEGNVVSVHDGNLVFEIDEEYFEQLPSSDWKTTEKDDQEYLELKYTTDEESITVTNNDVSITFVKHIDGVESVDINVDEDIFKNMMGTYTATVNKEEWTLYLKQEDGYDVFEVDVKDDSILYGEIITLDESNISMYYESYAYDYEKYFTIVNDYRVDFTYTYKDDVITLNEIEVSFIKE